MLNKVPEVIIWFWIIKILCTTVGESFADWINMTLGVGLVNTAMLFTVVFAVVLAVQMRLRRYVPVRLLAHRRRGQRDRHALHRHPHRPARRTALDQHHRLRRAPRRRLRHLVRPGAHAVDPQHRHRPRARRFYWLAVLVTFALGTATGDWTLELTGWGPGKSVLLPLALIAIVTVCWRLGANPVLTFWLAYILTRPLGANIGDWLAPRTSEKGLGLGTFVHQRHLPGRDPGDRRLPVHHHGPTSSSRTTPPTSRPLLSTRTPTSISLRVLAATAVATIALLVVGQRPAARQRARAEEGPAPLLLRLAARPGPGDPAGRARASRRTRCRLPHHHAGHPRPGRLGDQAGAQRRITDLETAWDDDQATLQPKDCQAWTFVDQQIDPVLTAVRASSPDPATEDQALHTLLVTLG